MRLPQRPYWQQQMADSFQTTLDFDSAPFGVLAAGVDEAGRGPLAGPVVAAAVVFAPDAVPEGIDDSKKLTAKRREQLCADIKLAAVAWHVAVIDAAQIDTINILQATLRAMHDAIAGIRVPLAQILVDGNRAPTFAPPHEQAHVETIIGGDASHVAIGAASIIAKTARDAMMCEYDERWPQFGFARHKGYGTKVHLEALREHGPCAIHRRSFAPVRNALARSSA